MHVLLFLHLAVLAVTIWGTVILHSPAWQPADTETAAAIVYGMWAGSAAALAAWAVFVSTFQHSSLQAWTCRTACFMLLSCSLGSSSVQHHSNPNTAQSRSPLQQLSETLHALFGQEDLTWSDYLLAVTLVGISQKLDYTDQAHQQLPTTHTPSTPQGHAAGTAGAQRGDSWNTNPLWVSDAQARNGQLAHSCRAEACGEDTLVAALRYQTHALAVYGWAMHMWANRRAGAVGTHKLMRSSLQARSLCSDRASSLCSTNWVKSASYKR